MPVEKDNDLDDEFALKAAMGIRRFEWGSTHLAKVEDHPRWMSLESEESVGMVPNEAGANLYCFMVTRSLKSATRCYQAAQHLLTEPYGAIPVEVLLRTGLVASAKALFLLQPTERETRESRLKQIYQADRSALDHAVTRELKLVGLGKADDASGRRRPQVIQESKVLRDVLDALVSQGNCQCGEEGCPQHDLEGLRHRIMRLWWLYSSVAHVNLWHIEKAAELAPSGSTHTTGDLSLALHDLGWLYATSVARFLERYEFLELMEPLDLHAGLEGIVTGREK